MGDDKKDVSLTQSDVTFRNVLVNSPNQLPLDDKRLLETPILPNKVIMTTSDAIPSCNQQLAIQSLSTNITKSTIVLSDDGIVFPEGTLLIEGDAALTDAIIGETQPDNEFDIKVESLKSENSQANTLRLQENVIPSVHFSGSDIAQFHIMQLSNCDIENLQKINHNVLMSQAALPEENKISEHIEDISSDESKLQSNGKSYLNGFTTDDTTNMYVKHEAISNTNIEVSNHAIKSEVNSADLEIFEQNSQQIFYIHVDNNGQSQLVPASIHSTSSQGEVQKDFPTIRNKGSLKRKDLASSSARKHQGTRDPTERSSLRALAPRLLQYPLYATAQAGLGDNKSLLKPMNITSLSVYEGGEYFEVLGRCTQCFRFSRTTSYCRSEKNHREPKSSVCLECEELGLSTVVCRRKLNHTAPNSLPLNVVINTALQHDDHMQQLCVRNQLPPCFAELHSIVLHHADITFSVVRTKDNGNRTGVPRKPSDFARGYLHPYSQEKWEMWLIKYCQQTNTNYRIRTGKRVNKKSEHGLANHNGKIVQYRTLETQLYNCALGGKPRKRKIKEGIRKRKERGSKLIGCCAVIHTRLLETENEWRALEVTVPKLSAHLGSHDPRSEAKNHETIEELNDNMLSQISSTDILLDENQRLDFNQLVSEENDFKGKEVPLSEVVKYTKNMLISCAGLLENVDNADTLNFVQEHGQAILSRLIKDSTSKANPPPPKKCKEIIRPTDII